MGDCKEWNSFIQPFQWFHRHRHVRTFDLSFIGLVPALLACTALMVAARDPEGDLLAAVGDTFAATAVGLWKVWDVQSSCLSLRKVQPPQNIRNFESTGGYDQMFPTDFVYFLIWHFNFAYLAHLVFPSPSGRLLEHNKYPVSVAIYPLDAWLKEVPPVTRGWESGSALHPFAAEEIAWFELLHWVAKPASNQSSVPQHFRAVLFMVPWMEFFFGITRGTGQALLMLLMGGKNRYPFPRSDLEIWRHTQSFLNLCFYPYIFAVSG